MEPTPSAVAAAIFERIREPPPAAGGPIAPEALRGWVENSVGKWIEEGVNASPRSKGDYRSLMGQVPAYLAALGYPGVTTPTQFRREHVDALKYGAVGVAGRAKGRPLAPKTRQTLLSELRMLLGYWGRKQGSVTLLSLVADGALWKVKCADPIRPSRSLADPAEVDKLLSKCDGETQVGAMIAAYSGLRADEVCALEYRDLELSLTRTSWAVVRSGKGDKPRRTLVPPVLRNLLLARQIGKKATDRVYPWAADTFRERLAAAGKEAGIGHVHPHRLRASFMTFSLRAGVHEHVVMLWVGHRHAETTGGYARRDPVIEQQAASTFERYLEAR